jgi:integrase
MLRQQFVAGGSVDDEGVIVSCQHTSIWFSTDELLEWNSFFANLLHQLRHARRLQAPGLRAEPVARDLEPFGGDLPRQVVDPQLLPRDGADAGHLRWRVGCRLAGQPYRNLTEFFGDDKPLRNITTGDCDQFKAWLLTRDLAPATVAKRLSFARTFMHVARKHKLIDDNPFSEVKIPTANVSARQRFIDRDTVQKLMAPANPTWRTIIALARFGGFRCPSEVLSIEWRHVDWERSRLTVVSPKTDRYDGKGTRTIPLFPELRAYLVEAFELAEPGQTHVVGGNYLAKANSPTGWKSCNLRTTFGKLVKRAGLEPWPRLFHNLRSSRETELLEEFPVHVVALWMGHDAKVSLKHYAQTTDEHFDRAAGGAQSGATVAQNTAQRPAAACCTELFDDGLNRDAVAACATPSDLMQRFALGSSGEGGIRTPDTV